MFEEQVNIQEGLSIVKRTSRGHKMRAILHKEGFGCIFSSNKMIVDVKPNEKINVFVAQEMFSLELAAIEKCTKTESLNFTSIQFWLEGSFRISFEFETKQQTRGIGQCQSFNLKTLGLRKLM